MKINIKSEEPSLLVLVVFEQPLYLFLSQQQGVLVHPLQILLLVLRYAHRVVVALLKIRHERTHILLLRKLHPVHIFEPRVPFHLPYPMAS